MCLTHHALQGDNYLTVTAAPHDDGAYDVPAVHLDADAVRCCGWHQPLMHALQPHPETEVVDGFGDDAPQEGVYNEPVVDEDN